jgi:glycosyltransferase involved in cell wall biosynthesis
MKISFLVTYYNQEKYVERSINSILNIEKKCDWEIIIGDDGSSDYTQNIVQKYISKDPEHISMYVMPREPYCKTQVVKRSSLNRINILSKATGDFFCFLDGDDWYCDTKFVTDALDIFSRYTNVATVAFGYQMIESNGAISKKETLPAGALNVCTYIRNTYVPAGACVFRMLPKSEIDKLKSIGFYDDNDIVIENFNIGDIFAIDRIIYCYQQSDNSTYNSMNFVEKALLNVQGFDVDISYLPQFEKELTARYSSSILTLNFYKRRLQHYIGTKLLQYYDASKSIPNSITNIFLEYSNNSHELSKEEKNIRINIVFHALISNPKEFVKLIVKG